MKTNTLSTSWQSQTARRRVASFVCCPLAVLLLVLFAACGGAKSDAKLLAKKACECQSIEDAGSADQQQVDSCWKEALGMTLEMRDKYKDDPEAIDVFEQVLAQAEKDCVNQK